MQIEVQVLQHAAAMCARMTEETAAPFSMVTRVLGDGLLLEAYSNDARIGSRIIAWLQLAQAHFPNSIIDKHVFDLRREIDKR